jgi:hypothetical protein
MITRELTIEELVRLYNSDNLTIDSINDVYIMGHKITPEKDCQGCTERFYSELLDIEFSKSTYVKILDYEKFMNEKERNEKAEKDRYNLIWFLDKKV